MLTFDPEKGLTAETAETLRERLRKIWRDAFAAEGMPPLDVSEETPAGQLIDAQAALMEEADAVLLSAASQFNPSVAEGAWQDALGKIYFLERKTAEPTVVTCRCFGRNGTEIPVGAIVRTEDGLNLVSMSGGKIGPDGRADVLFKATETGELIIPAGAVKTVVTAVPGWDSVTNPAAGVTGRKSETRAEFEKRRRKSVASNGRGTVSSLYAAIAGIPGVLACVALENASHNETVKNGVTIAAHSVFLSVYGGSDDEIAKAIYAKKDAGCGTSGSYPVRHVAGDYGGAVYEYMITRPRTTPLGVRVKVRGGASAPAGTEERIRNAVLSSFAGEGVDERPGPAEKIYASRFYGPVMEAGARELSEIALSYPAGSGWTASAEIPADELPVLSPSDVAVIFED